MHASLFQGTYPVPDEAVAFFRENGYVRFDGVLEADEVAYLREGLEEALAQRKGKVRDLAGGDGQEGGDKKDKILQMLNLWENYDAFRAYSLSPRLAHMARRLTGSKTIHLFHDQALVKPPGPSAPSPWHQDQPYWPSKEPGMLSCWMALDDVIIERGAMQFIPGSHRWGEFDPISFEGDGPQLIDLLTDEQRAAWKPTPVELKAGDCTWHHGLTFHYTNANTTDRVRRAIVTIYIPEGVHYGADDKMDHPLSPTITSKKGEPLRGTAFPQLA
jgi:phytanoyl-CoA hydroxylase